MTLKKEPIAVERHPFSGLVLYEVTGEELDQRESEGLQVGEDFSVFSISLSVAVSFSIALVATTIVNQRTFIVFSLIAIVAYVFALLSGVRWLRGRKKRGNIIKKVKARVGTFGDEEKEIQPKDLASLPTQETSEEK